MRRSCELFNTLDAITAKKHPPVNMTMKTITLVGQKDDSVARANDLMGREGKSFDGIVERVASPLGLNIRGEDGSALYVIIKLIERHSLAFDMLVQAELSSDSMAEASKLIKLVVAGNHIDHQSVSICIGFTIVKHSCQPML